jgi:excisionase family DNA binding protein
MSKTAVENVLLSTDEVAKMLAICKRTLFRLVAVGEFPKPIRLGAAMRWRRETIERFLSEQESQ